MKTKVVTHEYNVIPEGMTFRKFIRTGIAERDMTIKDLCRECDMDYHQFSTTYRQRKIRPDWIVRIAEYFNVELKELILMDAK
jgi:hypothetical protein